MHASFANRLAQPTLRLIVGCVLLASIGSTATAQPLVGRTIHRGSPITFRLRSESFTVVEDGKSKQKTREVMYSVALPLSRTAKQTIPSLNWSNCLRFKDVIRSELQLDEKTAAQVAEITEACETLRKEIPDSPPDQHIDLAERVSEQQTKLRDVLNESQNKRFDQMAYRYEKIFAPGKIEIRPDKPHVPWGGENDGDDWYETMTESLSDKQKQQIEKTIGANFLKMYRQAKPWVIAHLFFEPEEATADDATPKEEESDTEAESSDDEEEQPYELQISQMKISGLYEPEGIDWQTNRKFERCSTHLNYSSKGRSRLVTFLRQASHLNWIEPNAAVRSQLSEKLALFDYAEARTRHKDALTRRHLADDIYQELNTAFNAEQKAKIEESARRIGIRRRGVYASLIDGELRKTLELTDDQVESIKSAVQKLRPVMAKVETDFIEEQLTKAAKDNQIEKDKLGPPVQWRILN